MTAPRFPFWHVATIAIWFVSVVFFAHVIWAMLYLGKPVAARDVVWMIWCVAGLVWSVICFDRYTFAREHLMAERKLTQAYRALQACAELVHYRIDRGIRVYGTPLHTAALVRKGRALAALQAAQWFRDRRDGKV
jgi:hypothetical protein